MKVVLAGTVIWILTLSPLLWGKGVSKSSLNFAVNKSAKLHCNIKQSSRGPWYLRVVAEDSNNHPLFNYLYSVRKNIKNSMQDCNAWLKAVKKHMKSSGTLQLTHIDGTHSPKTKRKAGE